MNPQDMFWKAKFVRWMDVRLEKIEGGVCEARLAIREDFHQQDGFVHAGIVTTLADHSAGGAAGSLLPDGTRVLTAEFKVSFLRPAKSPEIFCVSRVLKGGKTLSFVESEVYGCLPGQPVARTPENLLAKASVTIAIQR